MSTGFAGAYSNDSFEFWVSQQSLFLEAAFPIL